MLKSHRISLIVATLCFLAMSVGSMALGANIEPKVGIVDTERVYKEAPRIAQLEEEIAQLNQLFSKKLEIRAQDLMLTDKEVSELIDLRTATSPKPADTARIAQLNDLERARTDELAKLQGTQNLTDQQRTRLKELQDTQRKSQEAGRALYNDYQTQLQSKANEIHDKEDAEVRAAVSKVGEAKGFTLVADKATILLGGTDLTSDVISRLDRKR